jgi:hypothetical protein
MCFSGPPVARKCIQDMRDIGGESMLPPSGCLSVCLSVCERSPSSGEETFANIEAMRSAPAAGEAVEGTEDLAEPCRWKRWGAGCTIF